MISPQRIVWAERSCLLFSTFKGMFDAMPRTLSYSHSRYSWQALFSGILGGLQPC